MAQLLSIDVVDKNLLRLPNNNRMPLNSIGSKVKGLWGFIKRGRIIVFQSVSIILYFTILISCTLKYSTWRYERGNFIKIRSQLASQKSQIIQPLSTDDLDGDGALEAIILTKYRMDIIKDGQSVWQSPVEWQVIQADITDLNHDQKPEVILLLWRPFKPWPIDSILVHPGRIQTFQNKDGQSCHIILVGWKKGYYREIWAGSALAEPLRSFITVDLTSDGFQELIALESIYADKDTSPARALTAWEWNGFGFSLLARVEGNFHDLLVTLAPDNSYWILTR